MPSAKQLRELRACIDDLPKVRRYGSAFFTVP